MMGSRVEAQSFSTDFEDPPYTSGAINDQDSWVSGSGQTVVNIETATEISDYLSNGGVDPGTTVHGGSQALIFSGLGGGVTTTRDISGIADFSKVTVDFWTRPLAPSPTTNILGANLGNMFMTLQDSSGTRATAFRFGYDSATSTAHIDYADESSGVWHDTGMAWETNTWYEMKFEVDYASQTYDFYVDGSKMNSSPIHFYQGNFVKTLGRIHFYRGGDQAGMILDDLSISSTPPSGPVATLESSTAYGFKFQIFDQGTATPDTNSITLTLDGNSITPTSITQTGYPGSGDGSGTTIVAYDSPTPILRTGTTHTNVLHFEGSGFSAVDQSFAYTIPPVLGTLDRVHHYLAKFEGTAAYSSIDSGRSSDSGDVAVDFGDPASSNSRLRVDDKACLTALHDAFLNDTLTVSFWERRHDGSSGGVFWIYDSAAPAGGRAFHLHCPYYNDADETVFFDTGGTDTPGHRYSAKMTDLPAYSGSNTWWTTWRHVVAIKNGGAKQVWIDGQLLLDQTDGAFPLGDYSDISRLVIGNYASDGGQINAWMDDVAIYSTALSSNDVVALYNGTEPDAVPGADTNLLAWWDLNDGPAVGLGAGGSPVVVNYTQVLQSSTNATGPFTDVSGTTSPYTNSAPDAQMFFRARKY